MAGNPFRRVQPNRVAESGDDVPLGVNIPTKKPKKKSVVIISPPSSPEEAPRRRSSGRISPPPPPPEHHEDAEDSDSTATADSDLEQATLNTRRNSGSLQPSTAPGASASGAPFNPFARTLATSEAEFGLQHVKDSQEEADRANGDSASGMGGVGRPAMDVEAFKNILMTGSAVPSPPTSGPSQRVQDSNSSTDVFSMSRQSLFDPYFEINQDTPRTSFDQMDYSSTSDDNEEGSSLMSSSERLDDFPPPAPPKHSSRQPIAARGPQTVSFADFEETLPNAQQSLVPPIDTSKSNTLKPHVLHRSPSDLNKPLPPPPQDPADPEKPALSTIGPTATTLEPDSQTKKVPPPPPPAARRGGPMAAVQGLGRSSPNAKSNSSTTDEASKSVETTSKSSPAPPPPPSRKTRPLSQSATPSAETPSESPSPAPSNDTKSAPMPPPPPRRGPSKNLPGTSVNRTSSTASRSSARKENQPPSNHNAPAPPPPRRGGTAKRESMDGVRPSRLSSETERRGSEISFDSGKWNPSQPVAETAEPLNIQQSTSTDSTDILADMNALQAEIDALRAQGGRG